MGPLLCTTSPPLRSAMLSCRLQPSLFAPCSYSTSSPPPTSARIQDLKRPRPIHSQTLKSSSPQLTTTFVRSASQLTSTSSDTTSAVAQPNSPPPTPVTDHLDWNRFLQLRKVRRRYNLVASIGSSIGTTMLGVSVISQQDMETLGGQMFGLDPFVVLGLTTAGFGALGWLAGPFVGSAAFNMFNRKYKGQIAEVSSIPRMHVSAGMIRAICRARETDSVVCRKKGSSITASKGTAWTRPLSPIRTRFRTTTARKLGASGITGSGSKTSGPTTRSGRASCDRNVVEIIYRSGVQRRAGVVGFCFFFALQTCIYIHYSPLQRWSLPFNDASGRDSGPNILLESTLPVGAQDNLSGHARLVIPSTERALPKRRRP